VPSGGTSVTSPGKATGSGATKSSTPTTFTPTANQDGKCEVVNVDTGPVVPDMLIVLDRSGSMKQQPGVDCRKGVDILNPVTFACIGIDCAAAANANSALCGGTEVVNRWDPSVAALKAVTQSLQDRVRFGLMLFPDPAAGGGRNGQCATGTVLVNEALNTAGPIAQSLDRTAPGGGTPTGPTLQAARMRIEAKSGNIDNDVPPQYVLLVTDGQPTCPNGQGGGRGDGENLDRMLTTQAITDLSGIGVTTYVLGYDAALDPQFEDALNEFARAGGTDHYRPVQNEQSIVDEIERITKRAASCTYRLASKPEDNKYVLITLDQNPLKLDDANGWKIKDRDIEIVGEACQKLQDGGKHALNVTVQCVPVILN
jgi:hypothetical protein